MRALVVKRGVSRWSRHCKDAGMPSKSRVKLDIAIVRALLDEVERALESDEGPSAQLIEELDRLRSTLAARLDSSYARVA